MNTDAIPVLKSQLILLKLHLVQTILSSQYSDLILYILVTLTLSNLHSSHLCALVVY